MTKPKTRKCRIKADGCEGSYVQWSSFQSTCTNPGCALRKAIRDRGKKEAKQEATNRLLTRKQKEQLKTLTELLNEAQVHFNRYIRLRDAQDGCISCGDRNSGKYDSGHYQTQKTRPDLRFHPFNVHKQCSWNCNKHLSGNIIEYRKGLIRKIGIENVQWLEAHRDYIPWTKEDAREIKKYYQGEVKRLKEEA